MHAEGRCTPANPLSSLPSPDTPHPDDTSNCTPPLSGPNSPPHNLTITLRINYNCWIDLRLLCESSCSSIPPGHTLSLSLSFRIHRGIVKDSRDWSSKRWNEDCQVEPVIILGARRQVPASARRPGVVAGNRRKCQFTPRTSRRHSLLAKVIISNPGLSVARIETTCYSSIINRCLLQIRPVNPWEGNRGNYDAGHHHLDKYALEDYLEILMCRDKLQCTG